MVDAENARHPANLHAKHRVVLQISLARTKQKNKLIRKRQGFDVFSFFSYANILLGNIKGMFRLLNETFLE